MFAMPCSPASSDHECDHDTKVVQEMGVWNGTVRIDIAVINGELGGFELKSDSDNLLRLPAQAELYSRVFDRMTSLLVRSTSRKLPPSSLLGGTSQPRVRARAPYC